MSDIMQIQRQIKEDIISSNRFNILEKNIGVELTKIGGYSNMNYRGIIKDISTNKIIEEVFYRKFGSKFGEFSESVNHEIENFITKYLAQRGYGPKLLYEVPNDYTISEYLIDTITLPVEKYFDQNIIEQLFPNKEYSNIIIDNLNKDNKCFVEHRLFIEDFNEKQDLSKINRDLSKTIFVCHDYDFINAPKENIIVLKEFLGEEEDREIVKLYHELKQFIKSYENIKEDNFDIRNVIPEIIERININYENYEDLDDEEDEEK